MPFSGPHMLLLTHKGAEMEARADAAQRPVGAGPWQVALDQPHLGSSWPTLKSPKVLPPKASLLPPLGRTQRGSK